MGRVSQIQSMYAATSTACASLLLKICKKLSCRAGASRLSDGAAAGRALHSEPRAAGRAAGRHQVCVQGVLDGGLPQADPPRTRTAQTALQSVEGSSGPSGIHAFLPDSDCSRCSASQVTVLPIYTRSALQRREAPRSVDSVSQLTVVHRRTCCGARRWTTCAPTTAAPSC